MNDEVERLERELRRVDSELARLNDGSTRLFALGGAVTELAIVAALVAVPSRSWQVVTAVSIAGAALPFHIGWWLSSEGADEARLRSRRISATEKLAASTVAVAEPARERLTLSDVVLLAGPVAVVGFGLWSVSWLAAALFASSTVYKMATTLRRLRHIAFGRPDPGN